jgi:hypothetical protein
LKSAIEEVWLPKELEPYGQDLEKMHSIVNLKFGNPSKAKDYKSYPILPNKETPLIYVK